MKNHHWSEDLHRALGHAILAILGAGMIGLFLGVLVGSWK
jgi:imidazoleglycerol phosphate dehydratase HisB